MKRIKVGIVGLGELGSVHAKNLTRSRTQGMIAICGVPAEKESWKTFRRNEIPYVFYDFDEMVKL